MRQIPHELSKVEPLASKYAAVKINIGDYEFTMIGSKGVTTCQNSTLDDKFTVVQGNRIAGVETYIAPWGMPPSSYKKSSLTLLNWDKFLYGVNLIGKRCNVSWGAQTSAGPLYSKDPTMYTVSQSFSESEGSLACSILLIGMMDWLAKDKATVSYTCNGTDTIKTLVEAVLGATLSPFSGQKAFRIVYDTALDGKYDIIIPGPSFKISKGDTRAYTLSRLLYMTDVKLKPGNEAPIDSKDTIHALVLSGDVTNQFSINDARIQRFFIAGETESIFQPNKIIVQNSSADYTYYGVAIDKDSHDAMPSEELNIVYGLASSEQASLVANAMLENIRVNNSGMSARCQMSFGQELYDRPQITSSRSGRTYEGTVTEVHRIYKPTKPEVQYDMELSFGKYYDPRSVTDAMGIGAGILSERYGTGVIADLKHIKISYFAYDSQSGDWVTSLILYDTPIGKKSIQSNILNSWIKYSENLESGSYKLIIGRGYATWVTSEYVGEEGILTVYYKLSTDSDYITLGILPPASGLYIAALVTQFTFDVTTDGTYDFKFIITGTTGTNYAATLGKKAFDLFKVS